jgi:hypothetical protein
MKKLIFSLAVIALVANPLNLQAATLADTTSGKILLQVDSHGEAWYVNPSNKKRYYMANGSVAYQMLRAFGLGISNTDIAKIPVGFEPRFTELDSDADGLSDQLEDALGTKKDNPDTDGDTFKDGEEVRNGYSPLGPQKLTFDAKFANGLKGKILLQTQAHGEAWYIRPSDGKRYYMSGGDAAYQIMRYLSLGITTANLNTIPVGTLGSSVAVKGINCGSETQAELDYTYADDGNISTVSANAATKKAWQCFTDNLKTCTAAYIQPADPAAAPYQIQGLQGDSCVVTGPVIHPDSGDLVDNRTCSLPTKYIRGVYNYLSDSPVASSAFYPGYATINIVRNGGGQVQYDDGTSATISCN